MATIPLFKNIKGLVERNYEYSPIAFHSTSLKENATVKF